jgi:hypothetical protein
MQNPVALTRQTAGARPAGGRSSARDSRGSSHPRRPNDERGRRGSLSRNSLAAVPRTPRAGGCSAAGARPIRACSLGPGTRSHSRGNGRVTGCEWVGDAPCVGAATESLDDVDGREGGRGHHHPHPDGGSVFRLALWSCRGRLLRSSAPIASPPCLSASWVSAGEAIRAVCRSLTAPNQPLAGGSQGAQRSGPRGGPASRRSRICPSSLRSRS